MAKKYESGVAIIGGGLAGLAAAYELLDNNKKVLVIERDTHEKLGGLAKESFGGIMMVDTPLQKKTKIKDSPELALSDWISTAKFGPSDIWPKKWAETYVSTSGEMIYDWLVSKNVQFLPVVNWPERGLFRPGNSVPRWHIAWGTGYEIIKCILNHLDSHPKRKNLTILYNHKVTDIEYTNETAVGCSGVTEKHGEVFSVKASSIIAASGGMCGGDLSMVKNNWFKDWGEAPDNLLNGSHQYADGLIHQSIENIGGNITHLDKQWNYAAGIHYPGHKDKTHGLSLVPPRSALWVNAFGERIGSPPIMGYTDTRYAIEEICKQPGKYSWQIMNWKIAIKELAVSGCDYMTSFREKRKLKLVMEVLFGNRELVRKLVKSSEDIVVAGSIPELTRKMNEKKNPYNIDEKIMTDEIKAYDDRIDRGPAFFNDDQLRRIADFRKYRGDRLRICKFQKINDPKALPLIAIREFILSRKSLGGVQTDLDCRVLRKDGSIIPGLYAVGETAGFGGGGIHGMGSLEGTFLGACILTGRLGAKSIIKG